MLKNYLISYDLNTPGKDYKTLIDALKASGAKPVLKSQWVARYKDSTVSAVANHFAKYIDANDRILVVDFDISRTAASPSVIQVVNDLQRAA